MGKKTICGGGSGSNGESVSYLASIIAKANGPEIPKNAFTKEDFMHIANVSRNRARYILEKEFREGRMDRARKSMSGPLVAYYWPKKQAESKRRPIRD